MARRGRARTSLFVRTTSKILASNPPTPNLTPPNPNANQAGTSGRCPFESSGSVRSHNTFNLKFPGNVVYYTIFKISLVNIMLCSKLHCHNSFTLKHIAYRNVKWRLAQLEHLYDAPRVVYIKVDVRLHGKRNSMTHGARPVH